MSEETPTNGRRDTALRVVESTPDAAYKAFVDPGALMAWLPPGNMTGRTLDYDFREGGRYRIELTYEDDTANHAGKTTGRTDISSGHFVSLVPGKRIVQSVEFESDDASFGGEMTVTWTFEPASDGTRVTVTAENIPSGINQKDHEAGLQDSLNNLARYLRESPPAL
jgi:uncharacterized protein YndB with AHSA1/START domain